MLLQSADVATRSQFTQGPSPCSAQNENCETLLYVFRVTEQTRTGDLNASVVTTSVSKGQAIKVVEREMCVDRLHSPSVRLLTVGGLV